MIYTRVILVLLIILILVYYAMIVAHLSGVINLTERKITLVSYVFRFITGYTKKVKMFNVNE